MQVDSAALASKVLSVHGKHEGNLLGAGLSNLEYAHLLKEHDIREMLSRGLKIVKYEALS